MAEIVSVLLVGSIVSYLMYRNINIVTEKIEYEATGDFETYRRFAGIVINEIRRVKRALDEEMRTEHPLYRIKEGYDAKEAVKKLSDLIRRAAFYETVLAKRKSAKEAERDLAQILSELEEIVREECEGGEELAREMKERIQRAWEAL